MTVRKVIVILIGGDVDSNVFKIWFGDDQDTSWIQANRTEGLHLHKSRESPNTNLSRDRALLFLIQPAEICFSEILVHGLPYRFNMREDISLDVAFVLLPCGFHFLRQA